MPNAKLMALIKELELIRKSAAYGNKLPRRSSKWYGFAKKFEIGLLDLNNIAHDLRYKKFDTMEKEGSPSEVFEKVGEVAFFKALRDTSLVAYGMNNNPLRRLIQKMN